MSIDTSAWALMLGLMKTAENDAAAMAEVWTERGTLYVVGMWAPARVGAEGARVVAALSPGAFPTDRRSACPPYPSVVGNERPADAGGLIVQPRRRRS
ncbi:hypothetical protein K7472_14725 [Streptomyces sp. PTM05]|uniref:Uncharacterized protein n=1 Tax=Streptantibioticus parmotrematis TaxID=2873249 RepID=A0ABS7QSD1_9ACTN|nr:hypothetical protein [Streptantibioticus parmotrematis]MBY8886104.1 hypothetical protein [Streptantibioticus parmotrematis]